MSIGSVYEKAYKGDFNQVKVKIDEDKSLITVPDSNNRLLIHWAALGGNENLVEFLIDLGSPIDPCDDTNCTPLLLASSAGRLEVVRLLIGKGANVNHKSNRGQSCLHYTCSKGYLEVAHLLLNADANVNEVDILGATPLHRAAAQGRSNIVELLLATPNIQLDLRDSTGCTPLKIGFFVVLSHDWKHKSGTVTLTFNILTADRHLACEEEREATACMLVKAGASVNVTNKEKKTPLDVSSNKLKSSLIKLTV